MPRKENREVMIYSREEYDLLEEKMTDEQAYQILSDDIRPQYNYSGTEEDFFLYGVNVALDRAMDALKRSGNV